MRHDLHWLTSWSLSMISEVSSLDFIDFFVSEKSHKVMQGMGFLRKRHDMVDWCGEGWYHLNICISPKSSYSEDFSPAVLKAPCGVRRRFNLKKEVVFHCVWSVAIPQRGSFGTTIHTALLGGIRKNRERDGMLRKTSIEPRQKNGLTFHYTGWLIGILIMGFFIIPLKSLYNWEVAVESPIKSYKPQPTVFVSIEHVFHQVLQESVSAILFKTFTPSVPRKGVQMWKDGLIQPEKNSQPCWLRFTSWAATSCRKKTFKANKNLELHLLLHL